MRLVSYQGFPWLVNDSNGLKVELVGYDHINHVGQVDLQFLMNLKSATLYLTVQTWYLNT